MAQLELELNIENEFDKGNKFVDILGNEELFNTNKVLKVVSLFSGCGGMDLGLEGNFSIYGNHYSSNPFEIIFANDIEKKAVETYNHNFNSVSVCGNIREIENTEIPSDADIVVGGFPCQDFSHAGNRKGLDAERGRLYEEMKRVIQHIKPKAFIAENVDGLRTIGKDSDTLHHIISEFEEVGYDVNYHVLNAADYGVPQSRKRVIIIGIRKDLQKLIYFPKKVCFENDAISPWLTSKEGIDDLWDKIDSPDVLNHTKRDYSKAKFYPGKKMQGNYRIKADKPSCTIRAEHHGNIEAHYRTFDDDNQDDMKNWRRLSVRECARIQSFPDTFEYPVSASSAYKQIGNAVPPVMGWFIGRAVYYSLNGKSI